MKLTREEFDKMVEDVVRKWLEAKRKKKNPSPK
jgi:hypothetical protein